MAVCAREPLPGWIPIKKQKGIATRRERARPQGPPVDPMGSHGRGDRMPGCGPAGGSDAVDSGDLPLSDCLACSLSLSDRYPIGDRGGAFRGLLCVLPSPGRPCAGRGPLPARCRSSALRGFHPSADPQRAGGQPGFGERLSEEEIERPLGYLRTLEGEPTFARTPVPPDPGAVARGRALFRQRCASCHLEGGRLPGTGLGFEPPAPVLVDEVRRHTPAFIARRIREAEVRCRPSGRTSQKKRWRTSAPI